MREINKFLALLLVAAMYLVGFAFAEETLDEHGLEVNCLISEEGGFIIQIDVGDDENWVADDMAHDDSVVTLYDADVLEGTFVARYDVVGDGDVTVGVSHMNGIACDHRMTWDLHVEGGAIREVTGGSDTASPDEAEMDPYLSGLWAEAETQFSNMVIEKNEESGWDVEIVSPMTHGAYIFQATAYYDCELDELIYADGAFWNVPISDDVSEELGDPIAENTTGTFSFAGDEENPQLSWYNDQAPEEDEIVFERLDAEGTEDD